MKKIQLSVFAIILSSASLFAQRPEPCEDITLDWQIKSELKRFEIMGFERVNRAQLRINTDEIYTHRTKVEAGYEYIGFFFAEPALDSALVWVFDQAEQRIASYDPKNQTKPTQAKVRFRADFGGLYYFDFKVKGASTLGGCTYFVLLRRL